MNRGRRATSSITPAHSDASEPFAGAGATAFAPAVSGSRVGVWLPVSLACLGVGVAPVSRAVSLFPRQPPRQRPPSP